MTILEPQLTVTRLVITKGGLHVYDENFHRGVNIIRGTNGSGKSTIMDFIFFALGGDFNAWKPEAAVCDSVLLEIEINGTQITLKRDITGQVKQLTCPPIIGPWYKLDFR